MKKLKKIRYPRWVNTALSIILLLGILFNVCSTIYQQRDKYFSHNYWQQYPSFTQTYLNSQYVNKHYKSAVPDETVYAYAGGAFIKGANPLYVIPDAPPLGKYLISLSILLFNNQNEIILLSVFLSLYFLFLLGKQVLSSNVLALIPVFLFSSEALFKNQLVYVPLFDIMQLAVLLGIFLAFNSGLVTKKKYLGYLFLCCLLLGCFVSIKFFASGITVLISWYIVLLLRKEKKKALFLTVFTPFIPVILLASYTRVFAYGYTLKKLIGAQKWIFIYHQGQLVKPFSIWPLLLMNRWYVWWGSNPVLSDTQWSFLWPVITILSFLTFILYLIRYIPKKPEVEILMVWMVCYLLFFSIGQITVRYFVILLPVFYIVTLFGICSLFNKRFKKT